jgi:hypothetical protein
MNSLFAIADLHLSLGKSKPMEIFKGWDNHLERLINNWNSTVGADDTVVIAGDISWAVSFNEALTDLEFINEKLNGRKIMIKGNHDYWWTSVSRMNIFKNINFLYNNAFLVNNIAVCGTRGWDSDSDNSEKLQKREAGRLEVSVKKAAELGGDLYAFTHYPPINGGFENYHITEILQKYKIKHCYYGHLHGTAQKNAFTGTRYGTEYHLISADFVGFKPIKI